jgi:hypothetical protein
MLGAMVAMAAALALAVVVLPSVIAPRSGVGPGGGEASPLVTGEPTREPTVAPTATPTPVPLAHAQKWFLSFDYPANWTLTDRDTFAADNGLSSASATDGNPLVFGFVGNVAASEECAGSTGGGIYTCTTNWALAEGSVAIRFEIAPRTSGSIRPTSIWTARQAVNGTEIPGAEALTIDGLPARFARSTSDVIPYSTETVPGATEVLWWGLPSQQQYSFGYSIVAGIRGPNDAELEAQAEALVAGIHFVPEPVMLPTDPAALAQARQSALLAFFADQASSANAEHVHAYDCFPRTPGASNQTTIIQTLNGSAPMTQPLPVTCQTMSSDPNSMQGWTVTLKQTWLAGRGYPAAELTVVCYTRGDGGTWGCSFSPISIVYPHVGKSKYAG